MNARPPFVPVGRIIALGDCIAAGAAVDPTDSAIVEAACRRIVSFGGIHSKSRRPAQRTLELIERLRTTKADHLGL